MAYEVDGRGTVAPILRNVAPRGVKVAPVPMPPPLPRAGTQAPAQAAPTPQARSPNTYAPIAYAQSQYSETGDPFSAMAQGMIQAGAYREQEAAETAKAAQAAELLEGHPDLQQAVKTQVLDLPSAIALSEKRDTKVAAEKYKTEVSTLLRAQGLDDIADLWDAGAADASGVMKMIADKDKADAPPSPTDDMKELAAINAEREAKGLEPISTEDFLKSKGSGVTVQNILPGGEQGGASEGQFQRDLGGIMAKDYDTIRQDAKAARTSLATLSMMEQSLDDPSFYSGFGSDQLLALKRLSAAVGIDPEGVSSMETFNALNKQAALASMGGSLGTGFSNADRDFVIEQVPSLANTSEGNRALIAVQRKIAQRKVEIADMATEYVQKNGVLDAGFEEELARFSEANPIFDGTELGAAAPVSIKDDAEYDALPSGAEFTGPDGVKRRKP